MPKLRNASSDVGMFIQWVGRKCRNHHPLEELGLAVSKRPTKNIYKASQEGSVLTSADDEAVLYYMASGRVFKLRAEEITEEDLIEKELVAVGY